MILEQEVEKIRVARNRISERCGHDPQRILRHYRQLAKKLRATGQFSGLAQKATDHFSCLLTPVP